MNFIIRFNILLFMFTFSFLVKAQKRQDPFARTARLPDVSIGIGFNQNTLVKYKVPGGSLVFNAMYFDFDRRFLVGLDFTKNINNRSATLFTSTRDQQIEEIGNFRKLIYNSTIFSIRGGWMLNEKLFIVVGTGMENLDQFKEYSARDSESHLPVFHEKTEENSLLFYSKLGMMFRFDKFITECFYSKRGIGVGINYFFGY